MSSPEEKGSKKASTSSQIDQVKQKHDELSKKILELKSPSEALPDVKEFINELRAMGRDISPGPNRDLLVSLVSYWATFYFQHSEENIYPVTALEPYMGPAVEEAKQKGAEPYEGNWFTNLPLVGRILVIAAPLVLIAIVAFVLSSQNPGTKATPTFSGATQDLPGTQVAMETSSPEMTPTDLLLETISGFATQTAVESGQTPGAVDTPVPSDTPIPTPGSGIENLGVTVQVLNLNDLQDVPPQMDVSLSFSNFSPGWSVHLLLQPLSQGLKYYPVPDYYLVEKGSGSGTWTVPVNFGKGVDLDTREQYALTPVMVTSDAARAELAAAVETGLERLPEGVFTSPQLITRVYTVIRQAYTVIDEVRIVYSAYPSTASNVDLYAMLPDGSDPIQLTNTSEINERYASISPDGEHLVLVGRVDATNEMPRTYSVAIMHTDGTNWQTIAQNPALRYDRPLWSPDGKMIAYSSAPAENSPAQTRADWAIYIFDVAAERTITVNTGTNFTQQPAWSHDGKSLYFCAFSPETATLGIYQIELDTLNVTRIFDEKGNEMQPMVSPDGTQLMFLDVDSSQLYIMHFDTGVVEPVKLQTIFLDLGYAVFSPDGKSIYFEVYANSAYSIYTASLETLEPVQLTPGNTELNPSVGLLKVFLPK